MKASKRWMGTAALSLLIACSSDDGGGNGAAGVDAGTPPTGGSAAASGGGSTGVDAGSTPDAAPATDAAPAANVPDESQEAVAAFLEAESYRGDGWQSETAAPRDKANDVSPHDRVRVWHNATLRASQAAGNGIDLEAPMHDTGSMAVKEFYDATDTLIGRAAMLKLEGDMRQWVYFCGGPHERCMDSAPVYGVGFGVSCSFCHAGLIYTQAP